MQTVQTGSIGPAAVLLALLGAASGPAAAQCTSIKPITRMADSIGLVHEAPISRRVVEGSIDHWRACANYGKGFPVFVVGDGRPGMPERTFRIAYLPSSNSRKCASVRGSTITLYAAARLENGSLIPCADQAQNLAHELGHVLGLNHAAEDPACSFHIMSTIHAKNSHRRRVAPEECQAVGQRWRTTMETRRLEELDERPDRVALLVFDLEGDGLDLSDRYDPVEFDIDGDGTAESLSWTAKSHSDAFLWLDRDGNGRAEGDELFGAATPTALGIVAGSGFEALRSYDHPAAGGDGDRAISAQDSVWRDLRLWIDRDHDGRTRPEEVFRLDDWGIVEVSLEHEAVAAVDGSLNLHRHSGSFRAVQGKGGGRRQLDGLIIEVQFDVAS